MMNELEGPMKEQVKATPWRTQFYSLGEEGRTRNKTENKREREGEKSKETKDAFLLFTSITAGVAIKTRLNHDLMYDWDLKIYDVIIFSV